MANRRFTSQFNYNFHVMPVMLDCNIAIGATGAVGTVKGPGITSVTRLSAGRYQIKLMDNYKQLYACIGQILAAPVTGSAIDPNAGAVGTVYQITTVGATDWTTAGLPAGLTPAVGMILKLAAAPTASTGRVKAIGKSGITMIEALGTPGLMLSPIADPIDGVQGGLVTIQCLGPTSSSDTTLIPTDPADGSTLAVLMWLSNSSSTVQGE